MVYHLLESPNTEGTEAMSFWDWLLRRKPPPKPANDAEAVRLAVEELGRRHARNRK